MPMMKREDFAAVTVRRARLEEQQTLVRLVRAERLNPMALHWQNFVVAVQGEKIIGLVQLRRHPDAVELGSLAVLPEFRGQGVAAQLIDALLAHPRGRVHMITGAEHASHYARWGFERIETHLAPRSIRRNLFFGRLGRLLSFAKGLTPRRLVVLERSAR